MIYTLVKKDANDVVTAVFSFDSITSFDESWSATVTTQTVEYGFDVTDNINIEAPTYSIDAILSSYSLFDSNKEIVWDGETFSAGDSEPDSHIKARDKLVSLFKERAVICLVESSQNSNSISDSFKYEDLKSGHFNEIPNCILTSLSISNPSNAMGSFLVSLKIQKINVAKVSVIELTKDEINPLLRAVEVKPTITSSQSKNADGENIDPETVATQDGDITPTTEGKPREGMGWFEVYDQKSGELKVIKDRIAAEVEMNEHMALTKQYCTLFQRSDGYYKRCRMT